MERSGLSNILFEAGLVGFGSINWVLTGKHYSRSIHCHKTLLEALERLLLEEFCVSKGESKPFDSIPRENLDVLEQFVYVTDVLLYPFNL